MLRGRMDSQETSAETGHIGDDRSPIDVRAILYAVFAYLVFLSTLGYLLGFVEGVLVPRSVDAPEAVSAPLALAIDCGWFVAFAVQHSAMARASFKERWIRFIPPHTERSTYVLASSLMLVLLFAVWQPIPVVLWRVPSGAASYALVGISLGGWGLALAATFSIDHFELFGLRQVMPRRRTEPREPVLLTPLLYRWVRHPLYLGFVVAFWATPLMTVGHALFAAGMSIYIAIGVHFEERDLLRTFGESYVRYRENVPAVLPWPRPRARSHERTAA
jgi:protein-S-isoprenylcysteine O-methyltransferase Ste14